MLEHFNCIAAGIQRQTHLPWESRCCFLKDQRNNTSIYCGFQLRFREPFAFVDTTIGEIIILTLLSLIKICDCLPGMTGQKGLDEMRGLPELNGQKDFQGLIRINGFLESISLSGSKRLRGSKGSAGPSSELDIPSSQAYTASRPFFRMLTFLE